MTVAQNVVQYLPDIREILSGIPQHVVSIIIATIIISPVLYFAERAQHFVLRTWRRIVRIFMLRRWVLVWLDDDVPTYTKRIAMRLRPRLERYHVVAIRAPRDLLGFPLHPWFTATVVLIDSDVTKFAGDPTLQDRIEEELEKYVEKGGGIVGTHDMLYRRVRNKRLQQIFGYKITHFVHREQPIMYHLDSDNADHPSAKAIAKDLPDTFPLEDGELIWGYNRA